MNMSILKLIIISLFSLNTNAFADVQFGQSCLILDEEVQISAALEAKRELTEQLDALNLNWRSIGIGNANVGASIDCPSITVGLDSQVSIETIRGKTGDFYKGFPVVYKVEGVIRAL